MNKDLIATTGVSVVLLLLIIHTFIHRNRLDRLELNQKKMADLHEETASILELLSTNRTLKP